MKYVRPVVLLITHILVFLIMWVVLGNAGSYYVENYSPSAFSLPYVFAIGAICFMVADFVAECITALVDWIMWEEE